MVVMLKSATQVNNADGDEMRLRMPRASCSVSQTNAWSQPAYGHPSKSLKTPVSRAYLINHG
jgi:hypothetical protein